MVDLLKHTCLYELLIRFKAFGALVSQLKRFVASKSYFPEYAERRKSCCAIFFDQLRYLIKHGWPNEYYFLYGFDIKGLREQSEYIDNFRFMKRRNKLNNCHHNAPVLVLREKSVFGIIANAYGINTPQLIGICENETIFLFEDGKEQSFANYCATHNFDVFFKAIDGECADGVYHLVCENGVLTTSKGVCTPAEFIASVPNKRYVLQYCINQHPALSSIFPKAINTIRLVTVYNQRKNQVEVLSALLRIGTGHHHVDNWAVGGLTVGLDLFTGRLKKYGYYKPGFGQKVQMHPDTGVVFNGYKIPFVQDAVAMATKFHTRLNGLHSIGWDIAITDQGPCFIEGNDNWEIAMMQICDKGLQDKYKELFY